MGFVIIVVVAVECLSTKKMLVNYPNEKKEGLPIPLDPCKRRRRMLASCPKKEKKYSQL
jgi:hypothetical protein